MVQFHYGHQNKIPRQLVSNSKAVNICEDKKMRQIVLAFEKNSEKFDNKLYYIRFKCSSLI